MTKYSISIFFLLFSGRIGEFIHPASSFLVLILSREIEIWLLKRPNILFFFFFLEELESLSHQLQYSYLLVSCLYSPSILITPGYQNLHIRATPPLVVSWTIVDSELEKTEIGFDSKDTYTDFWCYSRSHTSYKNGGAISVDYARRKGDYWARWIIQ